ncbi:hypothetical protein AB9P05_00540 [Roseivirga sp. BDSF3-8]|uniref:VPS10 domain-containing protein n=1 Tax=Roseivirga sp. BDSF3-8 TaxID=3241598 RepID=UPI0035326561
MRKHILSKYLLTMGVLLSTFCTALEAIGQKVDMEKLKGLNIRNIGPAGMSGRVTSIDVVRENPDIIFAGTASGGLWKSESGGISWKPVFDKERVMSIGDVTIYQKNPSIVWAGTGEGNPRNSQTNGYGVYKSLDGGNTWQLMGLENTRNIHRVLIHPDNPDVVYVGAIGTAWGDTEDRGVYKTTDGGKTWNKILYANNRTGVADMVMDPTNPNKLVVAMWEYRRWPWYFESGGEGSGLWITQDGGENWEERTSEDGLPEGELGRIGLAIAPSNPDRIYALVEAKTNALYRSDDGGKNWQMINDSEGIGNRPFYYSDIFVDPKNDNRLYSIHSLVTMSEDAGKSFTVLLPYSEIHPDHHAWYIHPDNPDFMMDGNDGGLNITRDRGESWRFVENLPLAQFYHINIDDATPYNVYGGMQDNGSWRGPAYVWREGGIRNGYWEELFFGDGFDVVPVPGEPDKGYAMSQGGFVGRYNLATGNAKLIRPVHPEGTELRFNWNAAIAQDPFDKNTIFYGSQFLHKSTDRGESWQIISPDLTTNDPEKQKQLESGGLTIDATNAENFTTIVSIAPSPVEEGVIYVGTDDGNLQVTRDGGNTWSNTASGMKGVPAGSWIPQIHASTYNKGEAWAVVNNYRRNDYAPYLYHTTNYGRSWERMINSDQVFGYTLSFIQDPEEPKLMFLGTEYGLYLSIDGGENWSKWSENYPSVSTMDMKIHPTEHDLVIGTFGRAAWVLDNIRPLREMAGEGSSLLTQTVHVYPAAEGVQAVKREATGTRFAGDAIYSGENRADGLMITYSVKQGAKDMAKAKKQESKEEKEDEDKKEAPASDKATIEVFNSEGELIRTLKQTPETGMNQVAWGMDKAGTRYPSQPKPKNPDTPEPAGIPVLPGEYKVRVSWQGSMDSTMVTVKSDPRVDVDREALMARQQSLEAMANMLAAATEASDRIREARNTVDMVSSLMPEGETEDEAIKELKKRNQEMKDTLTTMLETINPAEDMKGIVRRPDILSAQLSILSYYVMTSLEGPNENQKLLMEQSKEKAAEVISKINEFFSTEWKDYQNAVKAANLSPFGEFEPIEIDRGE